MENWYNPRRMLSKSRGDRTNVPPSLYGIDSECVLRTINVISPLSGTIILIFIEILESENCVLK